MPEIKNVPKPERGANPFPDALPGTRGANPPPTHPPPTVPPPHEKPIKPPKE